MRRLLALATAALVLGASLVGCSEDEPEVCGSVDDLKTSVNSLKDVDLTTSGAVEDLQSGLANIKTDLEEVKTDAKSQFSSQIEAVDTAYGALATSAEDAKADPSVATLSAVASAWSTFRTDVKSLIEDIQATC